MLYVIYHFMQYCRTLNETVWTVIFNSVVVKTFFRSQDQDRDLDLGLQVLDKMNSSALESRDHGLEITSLAASIPTGDRALT